MRHDHERTNSQDADLLAGMPAEDATAREDIAVPWTWGSNQTQDAETSAVVALAQTLVAPLSPRAALLRGLSVGRRLLPCMQMLALYVMPDGTRESLMLAGEVESHYNGAEPAAHDVWQSRKTLGHGRELDRQVLDEHVVSRAGKLTALPLVSPEVGAVGVLVAEERDQVHMRERHPQLDILAHCLTVLLERLLRDEADDRRARAVSAAGTLAADTPDRKADPNGMAETSAAILNSAADALRELVHPLACVALASTPDGALREVGASDDAALQLDAMRSAELLARLHEYAPLGIPIGTSGGHASDLWDDLTVQPLIAALHKQLGDRDVQYPVRVTLLPIWVEEMAAGVLALAHAQSSLLERYWMPAASTIAVAAGAGIRAVRLADAAAAEGRARDEFISLAAHELRSPLTSIKGYAQLLIRQSRKTEIPDPMRRSVEAIEQQSLRMSEMVGELLDASRIRRGVLEIQVGSTDLVPLAQRVIEKRLAHYPRHNFTLQIEAATLTGNWDVQRVEQILRDLLDNAARYSPEGGHIAILLRSTDGMALVSVRDEGIGIEPEDQGHIFDYLFRAPSAEERNLSGLGLGLYVCRHLAERMGGQLTLYETSSGERHGSEFRLLLPLAA